MVKKILALTLVIVLCLAFAACGSSEPAEPDTPDRVSVNDTAARFDADNRCLFTLYDDGTAEGYVFLKDYTAEGGTVLATYTINQMQARFSDFELYGYFGGDEDMFYFVVENGEINSSKGFLNDHWDTSLEQAQYMNDLAILEEEAAAIKEAIDTL